MNDAVIQADRLTRYFGKHCAVDQVSFSIPRGCIAAMLGRNGSGKTTIMRMLLGLLQPTRGSSTILGQNSLALSPEVRGRVGYVAEGHPLYGWMTVRQLAQYQSRFYPTWSDKVYYSIIDHFQLNENTKAASLSRGQRAGVALALALAPEPELLVLDDPSLGLDPVARRAILEVIINVWSAGGNGDRTILLSTHELQDVERIADRVLVLDHSVLMADAEKDYFLSHVREFIVEGDGEPQPPTGLVWSRREGNRMRMIVANPDEAAVQPLLAAGAEQREVSLEDGVIAYLSRRGGVLDAVAGGKGGAA